MTQRRRVPFILLVALGMVFALATSVLAAGDLQIYCENKTVDLKTTDTFEVAVKAADASSYATGMVSVTFDDNVFDLTHISFNTKFAPNNATYLKEDDVDLSTLSEAQLAALGSDEGTPVITTAGTFLVDFGDDLTAANFTPNKDDVLFTLTFKVADKNASGKSSITLTPVVASYLDADGNVISDYDFKDGTINLADIIYGDCNDDGKISKADSLLLKKYLAKWTVEINLEAADVTHDGKVSKADSLLLKKYLAKWAVDLGN